MVAFELSLAHLERALNHALSYSLEWPDYAEKFNNTVLHCELLPLHQSVYVTFCQNMISLNSYGSEKVHLKISATPSALLDMLQKKRAAQGIHISGDAGLAQIVQQAMGALNIDWEGLLADKIGDVPARQASTLFVKLKNFSTRLVSTVISDTADYLVDEKQLLPSKTEVDAFNKDVTTLRYDADRLEARIRQLEANKHV